MRPHSRPRDLIGAILCAGVAANPALLYLIFDSFWKTILGYLTVTAWVYWLGLRPSWRMIRVHALNLVFLVGLFVHAECVVKFRFSEYVSENLYDARGGYYFNKPYLSKTFMDKEYAATYITNGQGYRIGESQAREAFYDEVDWLFLGDSFTQAAQVEFEQVYSTLLYRRFPDRVILNAGISGFGLPQELELYRDLAAEHQPLVVVLQLCSFNDFMNVQPTSLGLVDNLMSRSMFVRLLLQSVRYPNPAALPLGRWAEPFHSDEQRNRDYNVFYKPTSDPKEADIAAFRRYLGSIASDVSRDGNDLLVILIPTKEQVRYRYLDEVLSGFAIAPTDLDMTRPNRILASVADSLGISVIDALDVFRDSTEEPFFEYDEHLSAHGHQLLADAIEPYLRTYQGDHVGEILSDDSLGDRYPSAMRDNQRILFQSQRDGNTELFTADRDLRNQRRLTFDDIDQNHPSEGAQTGRLLYSIGDPLTFETKVVIGAPEGRPIVSLTPEIDEFGAIPAFAPDESKVAYAGWSKGEDEEYTTPRIVVRDLATDATRYLTDGSSEAWRPVFAPDGRSVVYIKKNGPQFDICSYNLESGQETQVTTTGYDEWDPKFSHDGTWLAYAGFADGNWDLFVRHMGSGQVRQLTKTRGHEWDPSFDVGDSTILYAGEYGAFRGVHRMRLQSSAAGQ